MKKHPLLLFLLSVAILIVGALMFIQSAGFARVLKSFAARHLPSDLGIQADFSDLSVGLFPPSVSIRNPKFALNQHNLINLPPGSTINAKRIDLRFRLFQMFSGNIRINEVAVVDGDINLVLHTTAHTGETKKGQKPLISQIKWDELFQVRAESIGLENSKIHISFGDSQTTADVTAEQLKLAQWRGKGGLGYELRADLKDINSTYFKKWLPPEGISRLSTIAHVNAQGVEIDDLSTLLEGVDIHINGQIKGNVLNAKELPFDSRINMKADLASVSKVLPFLKTGEAELKSVNGSVELNGKVKGDLFALEETVKIEGQLKGTGLHYDHWVADNLDLTASYISAGAGKGEIAFEKALISAKETSRVGGHQPASGGKVEIGSFKYVLGGKESVNVPIKLERAHIQWLAVSNLKDAYPIDARITGTLNANYTPAVSGAQPWGLKAGVDFAVEDFQLDNQRWGQEKPLKRVLKFHGLKLKGPVVLNASGANFDGFELDLARTKLMVMGSITQKNGFELTGQGPANLADFEELAQSPIAGEGSLKIHVHGLSSRVLIDFDTNVKQASYLHLKLGSLDGRITWDDDPSYLIFDHVKAVQGQTPYSVNGRLDLGTADTINLDVDIPPNGNIYDVTQLFDYFTKDLWWFPRTLSGPVEGSAKLTGGISMSQLMIATDLIGSGWDYLGERVRKVTLHGGYDKGKYKIDDIRGTKQTGRFQGKISYDADQRLDWEFKTLGLQVTDLDHLSRLDVPFRGNVQFSSYGSGKGEKIQSFTSGSVTDLSVRGSNYPPSQFQIKTEDGVATGFGNGLGNQASFEFHYGLMPGAPSFIRGNLNHLDFAPTILLLNPVLMQDPALTANISGGLKLTFRTGEVERASGEMDLTEYHLSKTGTALQLENPTKTRIQDGVFDVRNISIGGPSGTATLKLRGQPSGLQGNVSGDLDMSILEFLTSAISKSVGVASLDFTIGGILKAPTIYGRAELDGGTLRLPSLDTPFENIAGTLQLRQNVLTVENLQSDLGGGRVKMDGLVTLFPDKYPTLALKGELSGNRLRIPPFQFVKLRGSLNVDGEERPYLVDGSLVVDSALSTKKVMGGKGEDSGLKPLQYTPSNSAQGMTDIPLCKLKIDVIADHGVLVQNDLFSDTEVKARITVVNTLEAPRIIGSADLVQGKMKFKDRVFTIQSANAVFDNPNVINPQFNLTATTDVSNTKVQLYASGRMPDKWKIDLTSNPAMSESEIISLLALGNSAVDPTKRISVQSVDRSAVQQGEAASLILQSMDFNREVQEKTGFELQLDEYDNTIQGQSIFSRNPTETIASPKIIVKRRLGDRVTLTYGSTVGVDSNKSSEANAEFNVTKGFSVLGVWDEYEYQDLLQRTDSQSSYGFDLKLQKRFR
jgi:hypothetical protein